MAGKKGTHKFEGVPTNHFNDYPSIIRSQYFIDALQEVIEQIAPERINSVIRGVFDEIDSAYGESKKAQAYLEFAKHLGIPEKLEDKTESEIKEIIESTLSKKLEERAHSMAFLSCFLKIDLLLKDKENINEKELIEVIQGLQEIIKERFREYSKSAVIDNILPPFHPPRAALFKELFKAAQKQNLDPAIGNFCNTLAQKKMPMFGLRYNANLPIKTKAELYGNLPPKTMR